jgi:hypothetical protein
MYDKVQYLDSDIMPQVNMDSYFESKRELLSSAPSQAGQTGYMLAFPSCPAFDKIKTVVESRPGGSRGKLASGAEGWGKLNMTYAWELAFSANKPLNESYCDEDFLAELWRRGTKRGVSHKGNFAPDDSQHVRLGQVCPTYA